MSHSWTPIVEIKNQWLYQQIDVKYPTKESLLGRKLYQEWQQTVDYQKMDAASDDCFDADNIFLADFHRLTVMFSQLQSSRWTDEQSSSLVTEFFAQIIYSEPCDLYLGFVNSEPSMAAIVTQYDGVTLVSDIVSINDITKKQQTAFVYGLLNKPELSGAALNTVFVERS